MEIGSKIKELRILNGLTQEELADRSELSKGFISQLENDLTSPSISTLEDILQCLGITISEFFTKEEEHPQIVFGNEDYFEKLDEELKELSAKKEELQKALDGQLKQNAEVRAKIDERKGVLKKMQEEFDAQRNAKLAEIENLQQKADELMKLAKDPDALAALEQLPEFIVFEDEVEEKPVLTITEPAPETKSQKSRKKPKRRAKSPKE